jgi:hypothetical protein
MSNQFPKSAERLIFWGSIAVTAYALIVFAYVAIRF